MRRTMRAGAGMRMTRSARRSAAVSAGSRTPPIIRPPAPCIRSLASSRAAVTPGLAIRRTTGEGARTLRLISSRTAIGSGPVRYALRQGLPAIGRRVQGLAPTYRSFGAIIQGRHQLFQLNKGRA
jgi:hypothetical protein